MNTKSAAGNKRFNFVELASSVGAMAAVTPQTVLNGSEAADRLLQCRESSVSESFVQSVTDCL